MKKRYFWIYVLPVLMVMTTIAFGVLAAGSAMNAQQRNAELEKLDWKTGSMEILPGHRAYYEHQYDLLEAFTSGGKNYFSSNPIALSAEEVDQRLQDERWDNQKYWFEKIALSPEPTRDGQEIMVDAYGERVGTVQMKQIHSWSDQYVCGEIGGRIHGIMDYNGKILMESEDYTFQHLWGDVCYKRPYYERSNDTVVFDIVTGEKLLKLEGDWLVSTNAIGYEAVYDDQDDSETVYFDRDFKKLTKVKNGTIWMESEKQNRYWQTEENGQIKLLDANLQVKAEYDDELLEFTEFHEGLCLLYYRNKLVCIDENLNIVFEKKAHIPKLYADDSHYDKNSLVRGINTEGFNDGLAVFTLDGCHYGVLDKEGNVLIEPVFKGIDTLTVMKNRHVAVCYEQEFRIGQMKAETGGEKDE
ncbi:MAG: hypothetical protein IKJ77_02435 [Firmicutes bacterium]|nr:hypothetical protein [Bacillota bacterium]